MTRKKTKPKRRGPPSKITAARLKQICDFVRLGSWLETAAQASGISRETLRLWLKRSHAAQAKIDKGRKVSAEDKQLAAFVSDLRQAAAESELIDLERIDKAAEHVWQASAWRLERRFPKRWGNRQKIEQKTKSEHHHTGSVETKATVSLDEELKPYADALRSVFQELDADGSLPQDGPEQSVDSPQTDSQTSEVPGL